MEETLNESTIEPTSISSTEAGNGENPSTGSSNPIAGGAGGDSGSSMESPFDQLLQFEEFDNLGDILGDVDPSDNPFAGGVAPSEDVVSSADGSSTSTEEFPIPEVAQSGVDDLAPKSNNNSFNPNIDSDNVTDETAAGFEGMPSGGGGSVMNADFGGTDTGAGNTDNGNGNNFVGDSEGNSGSNNQADGNGNQFYGNDNQANGNGNWNFGDGNQVEGNGNWNLNEESSTSNPISEGESNPLAGGNLQGDGAEGGIPEDAFGGNNPVFAGGGSIPAAVGGETPDTAENATGNQNTVSGNGNWSLGDNNEVSGNGNRPSGDDNSIEGNGNRLTGDDNSIEGNRFESDADGLNAVGNGDRYLVENEDGSTTLVSDESAGDSKYDYSGVVEESANSENESAGQDIGNRVYASFTENTGSIPDNGSADGAGGENPFGGGSDTGTAEGGENPFGGGSDTGIAEGGENPFGGGSDTGGAPNSNTNPDYEYDFSAFESSGEGNESSTTNAGGNPFGGVSDAGVAEDRGNPFGGAGEGAAQDSAIEFDYNWDFDFADSDSANQDSLASDRDAAELGGETPLLDETDFGNPPTDKDTNPSVGETPVFDTDNSQIELPNGVTTNLLNEEGESDLSVDTPIFNEEGQEVGDLNISFPEYIDDYFSSVFNSDSMLEVPSGSESEISTIEDSVNVFGADPPVLGEDNVLQVPGGFEFDLSGIMSDSSDATI